MRVDSVWKLGTVGVVLAFPAVAFAENQLVQLVLLGWALLCTGGIFAAAIRLAETPQKVFAALFGSSLLVTIGVVVRAAIGEARGEELPIPSAADFLTIPGYLCFLWATILVLRARGRERNIDAWLDAVAITAGVSLVYWTLFLADFTTSDGNPIDKVAISTAYSLIVFAAVAVLLRIGATPGVRPVSYKLLRFAGLSFVVADIAGAVSEAAGNSILITLALSPVVYGLVFAAAWHPSASEIAEPTEATEERLSTFRITASAVAVTIPLFVAGSSSVRSGLGQVVAMFLAAVITGALVVRLTRLLRSQRDLFEFKVAQEAKERANEQIARNEQRFRSLVQNSSDIVLVLDRTGIPTYVSPSIEAITGFPPEKYLGRSLQWTTHVNDWSDILASFREVLEQGGSHVVEIRTLNSDNDTRLLSCVTTNMIDVEDVHGIVINATDITDRRLLESNLRNAELFDPLTLLFNRNTFIEEVSRAIRENTITQSQVALAVINIDEFRVLNEGMGTEVGDQVLIETANRIRSQLRIGDDVARLSGDEFGVLLTVDREPEEISEPIERILAAIGEPMSVGHHEIVIQATAGIAIDTDGSTTGAQLMRNADTAVDTAKENNRGEIVVFNEEMGTDVSFRVEVRNRLRTAIENHELRLAYQPLVDIRSSKIVSFEALARWTDDELGVITPDVFIAIAERSDLILTFGEWALRSVCFQISEWELAGLDDFSVSVNLSGQQVKCSNITETISTAIADSGIDPGRLTIEITESILIDDDENVAERVREIRALGVNLAIDDFGTGYSSLNYLRRYEFDILKIDRDFVTPLADPHNDRERNIAGAIIELSRTLGAVTVAEGIENVSELNALKALGCDQAQGFFFYRPTEVEDVANLLRRSASVNAA